MRRSGVWPSSCVCICDEKAPECQNKIGAHLFDLSAERTLLDDPLCTFSRSILPTSYFFSPTVYFRLEFFHEARIKTIHFLGAVLQTILLLIFFQVLHSGIYDAVATL